MAAPEANKCIAGALGISQALNTVICSIATGKGRYIVQGSVRHTLADGVKISKGPIGALVDIVTLIPQAANSVVSIPPIVIDVTNSTDVVALRLAVATGGSDNASGLLCAQLANAV